MNGFIPQEAVKADAETKDQASTAGTANPASSAGGRAAPKPAVNGGLQRCQLMLSSNDGSSSSNMSEAVNYASLSEGHPFCLLDVLMPRNPAGLQPGVTVPECPASCIPHSLCIAFAETATRAVQGFLDVSA